MGRLPSLSVLALCLATCGLLACDEDAPPPMQQDLSSRGQAVQAKPQATPAATSAAPAQSAAPRRGPLCDSSSVSSGKKLPDKDLSQRSAGMSDLPERISVGNGEWVWINLWAAWCKPCKQEIPLLREWETRLGKGQNPLRLVFVSRDDDERQLMEFLREQPQTGIKSSYWLMEGRERNEWFKQLGVDAEDELPGHFLVDPSGKVRCYIRGAVEPSDFPELQRLVGGTK